MLIVFNTGLAMPRYITAQFNNLQYDNRYSVGTVIKKLMTIVNCALVFHAYLNYCTIHARIQSHAVTQTVNQIATLVRNVFNNIRTNICI